VSNYKYPWKYKDGEKHCACYDCGIPYGEFEDMALSDTLWELINPSEYKGSGLLCPNCITARLDHIGLWYGQPLYGLIRKYEPAASPWRTGKPEHTGRYLCDYGDGIYNTSFGFGGWAWTKEVIRWMEIPGVKYGGAE